MVSPLLDSVMEEYSHCRLCPALCRTRSNISYGQGNDQAKILIVGNEPSESEDRNGVAFAGPSGRMLRMMLKSSKLDVEDVWVTNAVMCRPYIHTKEGREEPRAPTDEEINNCLPRLYKEILYLDPTLILLMGETPIRSLLGINSKIEKIQGKIFDIHVPYDEFSISYPAMTLFHPSTLLRMDAAWDSNGPAKRTTDLIRYAAKITDYIHHMRKSPSDVRKKYVQLPDRGQDESSLGEL